MVLVLKLEALALQGLAVPDLYLLIVPCVLLNVIVFNVLYREIYYFVACKCTKNVTSLYTARSQDLFSLSKNLSVSGNFLPIMQNLGLEIPTQREYIGTKLKY